jgi:tetratricopeptide (TPR) repeat protein
LALLAALTLNVNSATRLFGWPWWLVWKLALAIPPLLILAGSMRHPSRGLGAFGSGALLVFVGVYAAAAATSEHPAISLGYSLTLLSAAALVVVVAREPAALRAAPVVLAVAGIAYSAASVGTWLLTVAWPHWQTTAALNEAAGAEVFAALPFGPRNLHLFGHWNYTAGFGVLILPWPIALAWRARGRARAGWAVGALTIVAAIQSANSRGATLGLIGAAVFATAAWFAFRRWRLAALAVAAVAVLAAAAATALLAPRIRHTAIALATGAGRSISDEQRLNMILVGGMMVRDHWFFGQGPGLTPRLYPKYRQCVDGGIESAFQLHCAPLQVAADSGLTGLAAATALVGAGLFRCLRRLRRREEGIAPAWVTATAGVSVAGYAVFALTDYQLDVPAIAASAAAALALLLEGGPPKPGRHGRHLVSVATAVALMGAISIALPEALGRRAFAGGMDGYARTSQIRILDEAAATATAWQPDTPHYMVGAAMAHLRAAYAGGPDAGLDRQAATALLNEALAIEPNLDVAEFNLGWLGLDSDPAAAAMHFRRSQRLVPDRGGVYFGLGLARLRCGQQDRALEAFALEMLNDPRFATSPAWDTPLLQPWRESVLRRAMALAGDLQPAATEAGADTITYVAELFGWLSGGPAPSAEALRTAPDGATTFFQGTDEPISVTQVTQATPSQRILAEAHRNPSQARALLERFVHARTRRAPTETEVAVLGLLAAKHGNDWRAWLAAPEGREPPFLRIYRKDRPAYATLAYNMDLPTPMDAYIAQDSLLVDWCFHALFPPKGVLPESLLVRHVATRDL